MKAVQFRFSIPRYAVGLALGRVAPAALWNGLTCTRLADVPPPDLPAPDWVRIRTRLGGICGTDLSTIHLKTSPYYSPLTSFPFVFGHENVGLVEELGPGAEGWEVGERVVVEPLLWCRPRGFAELCEYCARGEINRCQRFAEGVLAPGVMIGTCRSTGGSWSESFVAHPSQLYRVPEGISDENALMVEPLACCLHAVVNSFPDDGETVLIIGAGTIGLCTLAALRGLGSRARIGVAARYPFQAEAARRLGADEVIVSREADLYAEVAGRMGGRLYQPPVGKRILVGGVDRAYECSGSDAALDDALRLTRSGGEVVVLGVPGAAAAVDWTAIFAQELSVRAYTIYSHADRFEGRTWRTFDLALHLLAEGKVDLAWLVTHRFRVEEVGQALRLLHNKRSGGAIKAVFAFDGVGGS